MKRRRPQKAGVNALLFVLCCIPYIPILASAQQQRPSANDAPPSLPHQQWPKSVPESGAAGDVLVDAGEAYAQRKSDSNYNNAASQPADVRALATLAPAGRHNGDVRAYLPRTSGSHTAGLASRQPARSLRDWEVEDTVLMATVDGMIHARDRKTGSPKWVLEMDRPMVETIYHARNLTENSAYSDGGGGTKASTPRDFYWIVEPSQDGSLYTYAPGTPFGVVKLGLTVKQLAGELSPYLTDDPPVVYTGEKKTTLYTIDVNTGNIINMFSPNGSKGYDPGVCRQRGALEALDDDECGKLATLSLGRTDYTVGIQSSLTGEPLCTIRYFEWTPNNRDQDLFSQYSETKDNRYIYSLHDGRVMALDYFRFGGAPGQSEQKPKYQHKFQSPVVRVFDVVRPVRSTALDTPLVVLPQPTVPTFWDASFLRDDSKVFVNCTEGGSWYLLSETEYPMVTDNAKAAQCALGDWVHNRALLDSSDDYLRKALVGVHALSPPDAWPTELASLPAPELTIEPIPPQVPDGAVVKDDLVPLSVQPHSARIKDPYVGAVLALLLLIAVFFGIYRNSSHKPLTLPSHQESQLLADADTSIVLPEPAADSTPVVLSVGVEAQEVSVGSPEETTADLASNTERQDIKEPIIKKVVFADDEKENHLPNSDQTDVEVPSETVNELALTFSKSESSKEVLSSALEPSTPKAKKKAHRGQRGGQRMAEKRKSRQGSERADEIDSIVEGIKQIGQDVTVTPDAVSLSSDPAPPDNPNSLHNLVFSTDKVLGTGSGGTIVYEGKFEGRDVAVKRMLTVHYELASQEVSLLEQSEDHPNVIRYFCRREDRHFLYIALELCQASLFDLFKDRRHDTAAMPDPKHTNLIDEIGRSPVQALRQLAEGLKHLHALRIVHRDIKPQNMLVAYPKKNTTITFPRLIISDFGLCKTLPEGASTLIGATVNAGTTGWKAPELIHQPRDASLANGSQQSASNSSMNASGDPQPGAPGVKRAVDIFSLGCVFFYVLTQGLHPFDDEEGWMALRERNIKTNRSNLSAIEIHGPDTLDLIRWMLAPRPEDRPTAAEVLAHPFFWTAEERLEFLSLASDRFDMELRDGTSALLEELESHAEEVIPPGPNTVTISSSPGKNQAWVYAAHKRTAAEHASYVNGTYPSTSPPLVGIPLPVPEPNFLALLDRKFIDTLGKQRKYNGARLADLLRALRNKHHHWDDMPDDVKAKVGEVPDGYLRYWEKRFPGLVVGVWRVLRTMGVAEERRFWRWFGGRGG